MSEEQVSHETGAAPTPRSGLVIERHFSRGGGDAFDEFCWELRRSAITDTSGKVIFEQDDVEVPSTWSQAATNVVASKYFRTFPDGSRETSVRALVKRVVETIAGWGLESGYFKSSRDAEVFREDLKYLILDQRLAFNSPVWFNVGTTPKPQASACFILSVHDSLDALMELAATEAKLFRRGSGTGTNLSAIRSSKETFSGGGTAPGPVEFMRGFDAFAATIKNGGKERRSAKMVILDDAHPDITLFIDSKLHEEKKAQALIAAGYDGDYSGEAYKSVFFQNANHTVRVSDEFMSAVERDEDWQTRAVTTGEVVETIKARDLWRRIASTAHACGDPGLQYSATINAWHTCKASGPINASNPCSEYVFLDDSACNLASLNLLRFRNEDGSFDIRAFRAAVQLAIIAQDILVGWAGYPTPQIEENSHRFRPLGLGYANLGGLLMSLGLPYDSDEGRAYAASVTALMTGHAYATSARIADRATGPFDAFDMNRQSFLATIEKHRSHLASVDESAAPPGLMDAAREAWTDAETVGRRAGFRNAQVTVLAPTGTIGFMMDVDTTGVEPDLALIKYKNLSGGGSMKIVNRTVPTALRWLGYGDSSIEAIVEWIEQHGSVEGAPDMRSEHLAVFDCALRPRHSSRVIEPAGHVRMMAAVQPFLSGAISKTVNLPHEATVEDVEELYMTAWRLGLKAVAIYRDGCKHSQPMGTTEVARTATVRPMPATRNRLPDVRQSVTHHFNIAGHEGYLIVGLYEDGAPGEIFIRMAKEGSTVSGLVDGFATVTSLALQHGVPLDLLCDKFAFTRFEPAGLTTNPEIRTASSVTDYMFRWMQRRFDPLRQVEDPRGKRDTPPAVPVAVSPASATDDQALWEDDIDAPLCSNCGSIMARSGRCHRCMNCGSTSGCS